MKKINIQLFAEGDPQPSGGNPAGEGGNSSDKTYTQAELDNIVNERTGRATKSALQSFFSQKGLTEEEAESAMAKYLDDKKKATPDVAKLQSDITAANSARLTAVINQQATIEAVKQGVDVKSIPYVLKMADFKEVADTEGNINPEKLTTAIKTVLDDIPALKGSVVDTGADKGIKKIGGDGGDSKDTTEDALRGIFGIRK